MSYSSYANAAATYREREVMTASPAKLVVLVYDHVLINLRRAQAAHDAKNAALATSSTSSARDGVIELLATLDAERGAEIAVQLRSLYGFILTELVDVWRRPDASKRVSRIVGMLSELRDAFAMIANEAAAPAA